MGERRFFYLIGLAGSVAFFLINQEWFSWIVLLVMLFLPWFSLLCSLRAFLGSKLSLMLPTRVKQGSRTVISLEVMSPGPMPPFSCRVRVTKPNTGERKVLRPGNYLPTEHCGGYIAELYRSKVHDYLGLFSRKSGQGESLKVSVLPNPVKMDVPPELNRMIARAWRPKHGGGYGENHEIRPYRPGDAMNLVHWKLSAKADALMVREPMVPDGSRIRIGLFLSGTPDEIDRKLGRLLWLGMWLIEQNVPCEVHAKTGNGHEMWIVQTEYDLHRCLDELLFAPFASGKQESDEDCTALWQYRIGGAPDEN